MSAHRGLAVHEVAQEAGVAASTVRFYARRGILKASRTAGNARRFGYDAPCRIAIAKAAQRMGLGLNEIAELVQELPDEATPQDWDRLTQALVDAAEQRIAELQDVIDDVSVRTPLRDLPLSPQDVERRHRRQGASTGSGHTASSLPVRSDPLGA